MVEIAAHQNLPVRLHRDGSDITVRVRIERIGRAGGGIEPGKEIARLAADAGERAARQNLAVRLHRDGSHLATRVRIEVGVERAVRVQPGHVVARDRRSAVGRERCKIAADKNLAIRLDDDGANDAVGVRVETVQRGLPAHRRRAARQQHGNGKE